MLLAFRSAPELARTARTSRQGNVKIAVEPDMLYPIHDAAPKLSGTAISKRSTMTDDARLIGRNDRRGSTSLE